MRLCPSTFGILLLTMSRVLASGAAHPRAIRRGIQLAKVESDVCKAIKKDRAIWKELKVYVGNDLVNLRPALLVVCKFRPQWMQALIDNLPDAAESPLHLFLYNVIIGVSRLKSIMQEQAQLVCLKVDKTQLCPPERPVECYLGYRCARDRATCDEDALLKAADSSVKHLSMLGYLSANPLFSGIGGVLYAGSAAWKQRASLTEYSTITDALVLFLKGRLTLTDEDARKCAALAWSVHFAGLGFTIGYSLLTVAMLPGTAFMSYVALVAGIKTWDVVKALKALTSGGDNAEAEALAHVLEDDWCYNNAEEELDTDFHNARESLE
ncbi:unnamed protein product [Vitrella brassicaformis CCMP3155]|uniref:Uncharacterized protein n=2 Tax=Vitrella brassicaformis TaxID=1169539 RepID=A0A0G4FIW0_VITBC|nr:unnamed protein product [Vitrella brassicaformis CCMP3155]|eukprot:CEM13044.1 unnamed protein product [Vitrella brassicaformis CCMP3155]